MFKIKLNSNSPVISTPGLKVFKLYHKTSASIGKIVSNNIVEEPVITEKSVKEIYLSDNFYSKNSILSLSLTSFYSFINSIDINGIKYSPVYTKEELLPQTYYYDIFNQKIDIKLVTDVYLKQAIILYAKSPIY